MFDQSAPREIYKHAPGALFWKHHALSPPGTELSTWEVLPAPRFFHLTAFGISARKASHQEVLLTSNATYVSVRRERKEWNKCSFLSLIIVNVCLPKWAPGRNRGITSCHPRRGPRLKRRVLFWQIRMSPVLVKQRCAVTVPHLPTSLRGAVSHFKLEFQIRKIKGILRPYTLERSCFQKSEMEGRIAITIHVQWEFAFREMGSFFWQGLKIHQTQPCGLWNHH